MAKPRHLTGTVWCLEANEDEQRKVCGEVQVPGLRWNSVAKRFEGSVDAIAAACFRLRCDLPVLPEPVPFNVEGLYEYQRKGVGWISETLKRHGGGILADEMGLGKTRQAIIGIRNLVSGGGRTFVVCPAFLRTTWAKEIEACGEASVYVLRPGTTKKIKRAWEESHKAKWVVTSYDLCSKALDAAFHKNKPRVLILDEAHYLKGRDAKRSKRLLDVSSVVPYRLALTGSPMWARPRDYYQILKLLFGKKFGSSFDFDKTYAGGFINEYGGLDNRGSSNLEELQARIGYYMLRRMKKDVAADLPELTTQVIWLDGTKEAASALHEAMTAQTSGVTYKALEATLASKMPAAIELCMQAGRFLLFTWLREHAGEMWRQLNDSGTPCRLITGDVAADKRQGIIDDAAKCGEGVVATIDSVGVGINAQHLTDYGVFHALDWTHSKIFQAMGRIHRIGSKKPVQWTFLAMKDSMDEKVMRSLVEKIDAHRSVLGDGKEIRDSFDDSAPGMSDVEALRKLYEEMTGDGEREEDL
jgi:SNF2 family DNA or RNA helicase